MKISVVTVCFNADRHLDDALRSVERQETPGFEIEHIVVDGGSTDRSLAILAARSQTWRHVRSEPDRGIYDAMNKGVSRATGDYVGFLNADDVLATPRSLARLFDAFRAPADVVYGDVVYVAEHQPERVVRYWKSGAFHRSRLRFGWMPPHPTLYLHRDVFTKTGGFDTALRISADYEFTLRCLSDPSLRVNYVPEVLVRMRLGGASNGSLRGMLRKSREDLTALRRHGVGGIVSLAAKNARKLPQFLMKPRDRG